MIGLMPDAPKHLCPQCGHNLRLSSGDACPECGYFVAPARVQHKGALRYWRFLRSERRLDLLVLGLWIIALGLGYWVISLSPTKGVAVVTVLGGMAVVGFGHYLQFRRARKKG